LLAAQLWCISTSDCKSRIVDAPVIEALPPYSHRRIYADEQEEGPAEQSVNYLLVPDVCSHPVVSPAKRHKF
jgi:hypothetical protein